MGANNEVITEYALTFWAGFGWPHMALLSIVFFCFLFRRHIAKLFDRVSKISTSGAEFGNAPSPIEIQSAPEALEEAKSSVGGSGKATNSQGGESSALGIPLPPYCVNQTKARATEFIEQEIKNVPESDVRDYLISRLAMMRVLWDFENIYSAIFGGQIALLKHLNLRMVVGIPRNEVEVLWESHKAALAPHLDQWVLDQYLNFLSLRALIEVDGTIYRISIKGHEFLLWMTQSSKPEDKQW